MQDAFAYCEQLVRETDKDRFVATLFAPAEHRGALYALYAFNVEVARVRDVAREPLPGEIRLRWWGDVLRGDRGDEAGANPVAAALLTTIERYALPRQPLTTLVDARVSDLYDDPFATMDDLEAYAIETSSALTAMAARILGAAIDETARPAGIADAITRLLRALPRHAARHQCDVPLELLQRHGVDQEDLFAGKTSPALDAALAELRCLARAHLAAVAASMPTLPSQAMAALLPLAPLRATLDRLKHRSPFDAADLPQWRRQWLIWRAARNPRRIAG